MNAITGTVKNGQIVLDGPTNWPEGCRVIIEPESNKNGWKITEDEQSENPEAIRKWLEDFDAIPPLEMTLEEETHWQVDRQAIKNYTLAKMKEQFPGEQP
jgi:hypothetical protein